MTGLRGNLRVTLRPSLEWSLDDPCLPPAEDPDKLRRRIVCTQARSFSLCLPGSPPPPPSSARQYNACPS